MNYRDFVGSTRNIEETTDKGEGECCVFQWELNDGEYNEDGKTYNSVAVTLTKCARGYVCCDELSTKTVPDCISYGCDAHLFLMFVAALLRFSGWAVVRPLLDRVAAYTSDHVVHYWVDCSGLPPKRCTKTSSSPVIDVDAGYKLYSIPLDQFLVLFTPLFPAAMQKLFSPSSPAKSIFISKEIDLAETDSNERRRLEDAGGVRSSDGFVRLFADIRIKPLPQS